LGKRESGKNVTVWGERKRNEGKGEGVADKGGKKNRKGLVLETVMKMNGHGPVDVRLKTLKDKQSNKEGHWRETHKIPGSQHHQSRPALGPDLVPRKKGGKVTETRNQKGKEGRD